MSKVLYANLLMALSATKTEVCVKQCKDYCTMNYTVRTENGIVS